MFGRLFNRGKESASEVGPRPLHGDASSRKGAENYGMDCPVCWEGFNNSENIPYVLWCGHTLCRSCVMGLQWAVVKFPVVPLHLPLFITCPWCQFLSCRLVWKGRLKCPCKNFFLLWMVESAGGNDKMEQQPEIPKVEQKFFRGSLTMPNMEASDFQCSRDRHSRTDQRHHSFSISNRSRGLHQGQETELFFLSGWFRCLMVFGLQLLSKLTSLLLLLFILFYILPFSTMILLVYFVATIVFAFPSFLMIYFAFPSVGWLAREIVT
eukprot:c28242_g1_i2 orf=663-1460(+)